VKRSGETSRRLPAELVLALYIHMMGLLILSFYENRRERIRTVSGQEFSGVITAIGKDVQDFEISDEV
jgi:NADPH:quinone reductase-like Zn-dependent oxidoreductase